MDKQKEIENMVKALESAGQASAEYFRNEIKKAMASGEKHLNRCDGKQKSIYEFEAEALVNAGYGDVKQAVSEFAERIEMLCKEHEDRYSHLCKSKKECNDETCRYQGVLRLHNEIKELVKEVCGE